jgi:ribonuclease HI
MDAQFPATKSCIVSIDLYIGSPIKIVTFDDHIIPLIDRKQLIYYIDGSYSPRMQIGHSGFRASDGSNTVQRYSPQYPRRGSTESEVYAACLAIRHAMENHCTTLIIRTDNSKVEQLLCRPKNKDHCDYPVFCQILNQYRQENVNNIIRVERVRGHTTRYEQNQCEIKRDFAKIDQLVRKKNHRYIRRERIKYTLSNQYRYPQYNVLTYYRCRLFPSFDYF